MEQPEGTGGNEANNAVRDRLSRLSEASLRINESLDPDTVLQEVMDNARALTGARFGVITLYDDTGRVGGLSGPRADRQGGQRLWELPDSGTAASPGLVLMGAQPR